MDTYDRFARLRTSERSGTEASPAEVAVAAAPRMRDKRACGSADLELRTGERSWMTVVALPTLDSGSPVSTFSAAFRRVCA